MGLRRVADAAAHPLAAGGGAAGRRRQGLAQQAHRQRAASADADLPLLHPGRRRGEQLLHAALQPRLQADRGADDAGRLLRHGDGARRGLQPPARHDRHARVRVLGLHDGQGDEGQVRLHAGASTSSSKAEIAKTLAVFGGFTEGLQLFASLRDADELPALQQDEGHGPDHLVVGARRDPALQLDHQAVPHLRAGEPGDLDRRRCSARSTSPARPSSTTRTPSSTSPSSSTASRA